MNDVGHVFNVSNQAIFEHVKTCSTKSSQALRDSKVPATE